MSEQTAKRELDLSAIPDVRKIRETYGDQAAEIFETGMWLGFSISTQAFRQGAELSKKAIEFGTVIFEHAANKGAFSELLTPEAQPVEEAPQSEG